MFRFFENLVDPFPAAPPGRPPAQLWPFVWHYTRPVAPWIGLMAVGTAAVSILEVVFLSFLGSLVDLLAGAEREGFLATHGWTLAGMAFLVVVAFPLMQLVGNLLQHQTIFGNYPMLVRWLAHRWMLGQSMSFFQDEFAGRVAQKVMQTALAIRETVMKLTEVFVYVVVYFVGAMVLVGQAEPWLMTPLVLWLAGYVALLVHFVPRLRQVSMEQADARAEMTGRVVDSYTNIQTVKLFAHSRREQAYARDAMSGFMDTVHRQMRLATSLTVLLHTLNALLLAGIAGLAVYAWHQALISLGVIAVAIAVVMRIRAMSNWVLWEVGSLFENIGTVQDGINTLARAPEVVDRAGASELVVPRGEIGFERVTFHYGKEAGVIEGLDLAIRPGEKVGLVGRSGAGKSTLVNLLLRFYDPEAGCILIDGRDIATVTQESLRGRIGMVTQDTSLLHRSIRDNIRYGSPDASQELVEAAARRAHAHDFILELEDQKGRRGYDAFVGERGVKLSGGQRQRIAIARAILKNPPLLLLDEATSALDAESERQVQQALDRLMAERTTIVIAHRLATVLKADRIVVLEGGRVVATGSHDELVAQDGLYARLARLQFAEPTLPEATSAA